MRLLRQSGINSSDLVSFDDRPGADYSSLAELLHEKKPNTLVVSPGYPLAAPEIRDFSQRGGFITSELALATAQLRNEKVLGITGSLGKSTVTALIGDCLAAAGVSVFVGGNFGVPLADYIVERNSGKRAAVEWVVLELSSYQMENCGELQCEQSLITYLAPNHLERYRDITEYYETKWTLEKRTKNFIFLNDHGGDLVSFAQAKNSAKARWVAVRNTPEWQPEDFQQARLLGTHNRDNLVLAEASAHEIFRNKFTSPEALAEAKRLSRNALLNFPGLPHRLQQLMSIRGIRFVNDSKATAIPSVKTAIAAAQESTTGIIYLLLGGKDKGLPWEELLPDLESEKIKPIFFGHLAKVLQSRLNPQAPAYENLRAAVASLKNSARKGDLVLLSPGGTSLDEFTSFEERGRMFETYLSEIFA